MPLHNDKPKELHATIAHQSWENIQLIPDDMRPDCPTVTVMPAITSWLDIPLFDILPISWVLTSTTNSAVEAVLERFPGNGPAAARAPSTRSGKFSNTTEVDATCARDESSNSLAVRLGRVHRRVRQPAAHVHGSR